LEATLKELWAGASPQHRTATRKLLLLDPKRAVFAIGDLLSNCTSMLYRPDEGALGRLDPILVVMESRSGFSASDRMSF
jgi:hypothetical protein